MAEVHQDQIAPIKHSGTSVAVNTAAGAGVGAVKGGLRWGGKTIALGAILGASLSLLSNIAIPGLGGIMSVIGPAIGWAFGGAAIAILPAIFAGGFGALFGGVKGGVESRQRVKLEKGAHTAMEAQLEAYKYNAIAQAAANSQGTTVYAPSATNYTTAPQGSAMNPAMPHVQGAQYDGLVNAQQLEAARV